jgi:hypothetical protein
MSRAIAIRLSEPGWRDASSDFCARMVEIAKERLMVPDCDPKKVELVFYDDYSDGDFFWMRLREREEGQCPTPSTNS